MLYWQLYSAQNPTTDNRPGLQSRDCSHSRREFWRTHFRPSCSVNHVINFVTGRWEHVTSFVKARDWLTGYDVRGRVLLCWPAGWCFKSREAWASALCRWSRFFFSAGCTLKPVSWPSTSLTTDIIAGSARQGLESQKTWVLKNALPTFLVGENTWPASWLFGRTRDWLTGDDVSIRVLCVMLYWQLYSAQNPTTDNRPGLQSRDCSHSRREFWRTHFRPSCSVNHVINFVTGRWEHVTSFVKARDWLTGYDVRGRVLLCWPAGWCFKSREAWASALCRWSRFFFSAGCTLKPVSWPSTSLTTDIIAGSTREGLRVIKDEVPSM